jgi:hypothetical protein
MSDELHLNGKTYVSSKRAAELSGYARDYIGQLSRGGHIQAERVGGLWYVDMESLQSYESSTDASKHDAAGSLSKETESALIFEGRDYISASRASKLSGYNQDYVGQLARGGKIPSRQIGNRWYVDRDALLTHKAEKDALLAAVQAEAMGLKPAQEPVMYDVPHLHTPQPATQYVPERRDLIPVLRKVDVPAPSEASRYAVIIPPKPILDDVRPAQRHIPRAEALVRPPAQRKQSGTGKKIAIGLTSGVLTTVVVLGIALFTIEDNVQIAEVRESVRSSALAGAAAASLDRIGDMVEDAVSPELRYNRLEQW